ncbi:helix-turn-helix transcriptional regulator [Agrilactobacillus composti]|nr:AraC family transcriptional regulator [Agrilactobacillus composti]
MLDQLQLNPLNNYFNQLVYAIGSYHYNWHPQIELLWLLQGQIEVNVDGARYTLGQDGLMSINPNIGHATFALTPDSIALRLHIDPRFYHYQGVNVLNGQFNLNSAQRQVHPNYDTLRHSLAQLYLGQVSENLSAFEQNALFYQISSLLYHDFFTLQPGTQAPAALNSDQLNIATAYLDTHYQSEITLESLAKFCNYSPSYLSKLFKAQLGINFYEYLVRCRLQHAVYALADHRQKIVDVALVSGFKEVKSFNAMFKKHFGQTPSAYRKTLSPEILSQDQKFKRALSIPQHDQILKHLVTIVTQDNTTQVNDPCATCNFNQAEQKYQNLKNRLQQLLDAEP